MLFGIRNNAAGRTNAVIQFLLSSANFRHAVATYHVRNKADSIIIAQLCSLLTYNITPILIKPFLAMLSGGDEICTIFDAIPDVKGLFSIDHERGHSLSITVPIGVTDVERWITRGLKGIGMILIVNFDGHAPNLPNFITLPDGTRMILVATIEQRDDHCWARGLRDGRIYSFDDNCIIHDTWRQLSTTRAALYEIESSK
jgi:hypothetical protein